MFYETSVNKMAEYRLSYGWYISFPESWNYETVNEYQPVFEGEQQIVVYPNDSDLTYRIIPMHVERDGELAPKEVLRNAFLHSCKDNFKPFLTQLANVDGAIVDCAKGQIIENDSVIHEFSYGIAIDGDYLNVNIFGTKLNEVEETSCYINTLHR